MAIEYVVDSLDQVGEDIKPAYVETDGKFHLDADRYAELKAAGLKNKNKELLDKLTKAQGAAKIGERFKDVPDEEWEGFQEWKRAQSEGGDPSKKQGDGGALEKAMAAEKKRFERQLAEQQAAVAERDAKLTTLEKQIREYTIWGPVKDLAVEHGVLGDRMEAFITLLRAQGRFDLDEDGAGLVFKNADGSPTLQKPKEAFKLTLMNEFPWAFAASNTGGSGAPNGTSGRGRSTDWSKLPAEERLRLAREQGVNK